MIKLACLFVLVAACHAEQPAQSKLVSGTITSSATWSGDIDLSGFVTIAAGATITVEPGTNIDARIGSELDVVGTLDIQGEQGNVVTLATPQPGDYWLGIDVEGTLTMHYGVQRGGGMQTSTKSASIAVFDSELSDAVGDFVVANGGTVDIEYTTLGIETGDHSHCNLHINEPTQFAFTHSTNAGSSYGLMLYAGTGDFRHSNWIGNYLDVEPDPAGTGVFDDGYFARGMPVGVPGSSFSHLSATKLTDCGPR